MPPFACNRTVPSIRLTNFFYFGRSRRNCQPQQCSFVASSMAGAASGILLLFTFTLLGCGPPPAEALISREGTFLLAFKAAILDPGGVLSNWRPAHPSPCNWTGVRCDPGSKNVISINLAGCNLSGMLVPELGGLRKLHRLYLQYNDFYGEIPQHLGNCTHMRTLSLHHNNLYGGLPIQLENLGLLRTLYLQKNHFTGTIPSMLGNLTSLMILDLSNNFLVGNIPSVIGNLNNLIYLNLSYNRLNGTIPSNGVFPKFKAKSFIGNAELCMESSACQHSQSEVSSPTITNYTAPISSSKAHGGLSVIAIAGICVGAFLFFKGFCISALLWRWSKHTGHKEINLGTDGKLVMFPGGSSISSSRELLRCIGKLEAKDVVGEGGYGVVYKVVDKYSNVFAVKKLKQCLESIRGFEAELETLGAIKHRNLVRLLGYCTSCTVKLLIYEYLPNGNLEQALHGHAAEQKPLDWTTRHSIALGVARGLAYLHHDCYPPIIHRDISSANVLLDSDLQPHLTDFGLARVLGLYETHITATVAGTFGYIAPEYAEASRVSDKVDVYSFGVLLLELLTGKRSTDSSEGEDISLAAWVHRVQENGETVELFDKTLRATAHENELQTALLVARACVSKKPENRPSMKRVVEYLEMDELQLSSISSLYHDNVREEVPD